jgi:hypothetical protein
MTRSFTTGDWVPCITRDHIADPFVSRSDSIEKPMESAKRMDERHIEEPRNVCGACARVILFSLALIQNPERWRSHKVDCQVSRPKNPS